MADTQKQTATPPDYYCVKSDGALDIFHKEESAREFAQECARSVVIPLYTKPVRADSYEAMSTIPQGTQGNERPTPNREIESS